MIGEFNKENYGYGVLLGVIAGIGYTPHLIALFGPKWKQVIHSRRIDELSIPNQGELPFWEKPISIKLIEELKLYIDSKSSVTIDRLRDRYGIDDGDLKSYTRLCQALDLKNRRRLAEDLQKKEIEIRSVLLGKHDLLLIGLKYPHNLHYQR